MKAEATRLSAPTIEAIAADEAPLSSESVLFRSSDGAGLELRLPVSALLPPGSDDGVGGARELEGTGGSKNAEAFTELYTIVLFIGMRLSALCVQMDVSAAAPAGYVDALH